MYGRIISVVYTNEENGWTVLRMETPDGGMGVVVGTIPSAYPGEELHVFGQWTNHPSHGRQFKAEYAERSLPRTKEAIYCYLANRAVKGIGPATAALIVDRFGDKTLDVLESSPQRLTEIRGISALKAEKISRDFRRQAGLRRLMEFLCAHALRPILAVRLYRFYADAAMDTLCSDPYIIAAPHIGGSFAEADHLAFELGGAANSPQRIKAAAVFELRHNAGNGHCFIPTDKLAAARPRSHALFHGGLPPRQYGDGFRPRLPRRLPHERREARAHRGAHPRRQDPDGAGLQPRRRRDPDAPRRGYDGEHELLGLHPGSLRRDREQVPSLPRAWARAEPAGRDARAQPGRRAPQGGSAPWTSCAATTSGTA